ncbi:uncharacterized protein LOC115816222 [Chanos chanos]|uniref:Uncharacterized protein LOC115816222 n=1 Tax=Chanos chanos TaxID=29144 RepID=A0A6J2VSJ8_CHACN|nr:uncharacterized protein LOC115816222 [Chanos chanos]
MLHINKLSVPQQAKPHPYMKQVYQLLDNQQNQDLSWVDGTLVQSFRSTQDSRYGLPSWIWFNISQLKPSMTVAELVLLRKTLHPEPLSISVSVYSISPRTGNLSMSGPLVEQLLALDQLPPSGYDVFDVSAALTHYQPRPEVLGFQLHYGDESGSLVLHEALTQSFYCLNTSSISQPLLVAYRAKPKGLHQQDQRAIAQSSERKQRLYCRSGYRNQPYQRSMKQSNANSTCRLHSHYVDVRKSGLGQWILQPSVFSISYCSSICTAQKLSTLTVMYRHGTNDFIQKLKDFRAESCVCQAGKERKKQQKHN